MYRKTGSICLAILTALCLFGTLSRPVHAETGAFSADTLDHYLRSCVENARIPALSVTIVDREKTLFSQSYGGCENNDTPFLLGSVSKSFTAACIMQLAEQGRIDLDAELSAYLPQFDLPVRVRQLLNHTSGLDEHQTLKNCRVVHPQGVHHYANVNYSLLGQIIEAVSGQSYADYITQHLLEPLGLSHTAPSLEESLKNGLIDGYINYWGLHLKSSPHYPVSDQDWITLPAGYLSSSANDLGRYLQMYLNDGQGVLSEESIQTMFYRDTVYVEGDIPFWYGYGWTTVKEPLSEPVLRHSGLVETGTSCVFILPESGLAVAVTANVNDYFVTNEMMDRLGWGIVLMLLGSPPNEISGGEYLLSHLRIDLIMLAVLAAAVLGVILSFKRGGRGKKAWLSFLLIHLVLPVLILLIVPVGFATPLWVARAFVPDVFITVVLSALLLLISGIIRGIGLLRGQSSKDRPGAPLQ